MNESVKRWFTSRRSISRCESPANMIFALRTYSYCPIESKKKCVRRYSFASQENICFGYSDQFEMIAPRINEFFIKLYKSLRLTIHNFRTSELHFDWMKENIAKGFKNIIISLYDNSMFEGKWFISHSYIGTKFHRFLL